MKTLLIGIAIIALVGFTGKAYTPTRFFDRNGEVDNSGGRRVWRDVITPTTGNGQVIDISSAGFAQVTNLSILPLRNTATTTQIPTVSLKSVSNTSISVNIVQANTVNLNAANVALGLNVGAMQFATELSDIRLYVEVRGR